MIAICLNLTIIEAIVHDTLILIRFLVFETFMIDHSVWPCPSFTMAWTLIHNTEILTHISLLFAFYIRCYFNFLVCSVTLLFCCHNPFLFYILRATVEKLCVADISWFI